MILLFCGLPGSGKTYESVTKIVANLANGREVFTNIDGLDDPDCRHVIKELCDMDDFTFENSLHFLQPDQVPNFWDYVTEKSFVLIDECHKYWNARDFSKSDNRALSDWASTHRHHGIDVVFMTQKPEKLDSQVRSLAQWTHEFRKLNMFGRLVRNGYQVFVYEGEPSGRPLSTQFRSYNPKFFKAYKSYTNSDIKELGVVKAPNILNHWSVWACLVVFVLTGYFFSKSSFAKGKVIDYEIAGPKVKTTPAPLPPGVQPGQAFTYVNAPPAAAPGPPAADRPAVSAPASSVVSVPAFVWLPVSMYLKAEDGREFLYVRGYRLSTWLEISEDKKLVKVDPALIPSPVLETSSYPTAFYQ